MSDALSYNFGGIEGAASEGYGMYPMPDTEKGVTGMFASTGDAGTKGSGLPSVPVVDLQLDQNRDVMAGTALPSVTDIVIDGFDPDRVMQETEKGITGMNAFSDTGGDMDSFVLEDSTSGAGVSPMGWDILKNDAFSGSEFDPQGRLLVGTDGGIWSDGDGKDDLATCQPDGTSPIGHGGWLIGNGLDAQASPSLAGQDIPQMGLLGANPLCNNLLDFTKVMLKQGQDPTNGGGADEPWTVIVVTDHGTSLPAVQYGSGDADPFVDPNSPDVELIGLALRIPDDFIL